MDQIINQYRKLIRLLEAEEESISIALSDVPLQLYLCFIHAEKEMLEKNMNALTQTI